MLQIIPTFSDPFSTQRVRLSGVDYLMRSRWNGRQALWRLDLLTDGGEPLVLGMALVCGSPLLEYEHHDDRVPPGELMVVSTNSNIAPPGLAELGEGKRCTLVYIT